MAPAAVRSWPRSGKLLVALRRRQAALSVPARASIMRAEIALRVVQSTDDKQVRLVEVPDPQPQGEWVVVKILSAPMCTEYKAYKAGRGLSSMGHEAAGEVVAVDQSSLVQVGDRVAVMPQTSCGVCDLCLAGEYIHCQNQPKPDELGERMDHLPKQLSGGERLRVAVARAVVGDPQVVLADEPTGSLDAESAKRVMALIHSISESLGTAFVIVSHDEGSGVYANRIVRLSEGHLVNDV